MRLCLCTPFLFTAYRPFTKGTPHTEAKLRHWRARGRRSDGTGSWYPVGVASYWLIVELTGAALILLAYWANAGGRWSRDSAAYLWLNLLGSVLLGLIAFLAHRWGFVMLEIVWFGISLAGLLHRRHSP